MKQIVDLRSDTVTKPTPEMRKAMADAEVGDDVYREDPTVNKLEKMAAMRLGKEAGLFIPSGTMGNLVALLTHCQRCDEIIMGDQAHTFIYEVGGVSALGGIMVRTVKNQSDGTMLLDELVGAIRGEDIHFPPTALIALENTHNRCGGVPITLEYTNQVANLARQHNLKLHLDGARLFNAAIKFGIDASILVEKVDSVTFCLSKGLAAPVGSVLVGSLDFIQRARKIRKQLGGGMRQAGIIAAAGVVALETMIDRLEEDHQNAKILAEGLSTIPHLKLRPGSPQTNMVFIDVDPGFHLNRSQIAQALGDLGVLVGGAGLYGFRLVTHYGITDESIKHAVSAFEQVMES